MRLQQLSVIFVIIILPIAIVIEAYINNLIDVSNKERSYDTILYNSTYDCVKAYQINTLNNSFANVNISRDRDVNASINSFFTSLASGFSASGYTKNDLKDYIPAMLFTLYDGYYVYGPYENSAKLDVNESTGKTSVSYYDNINKEKRSIEYGLKPYTYYSCEYADGNTYDIIVNYTLDNYISVSGWYGSKDNYFTKAGYYINPDKIVGNPNPDNREVVIKANQNDSNSNETVTLKPEELYEYITYFDDYEEGNGSKKVLYTKQTDKARKYRYINYNEEKYYYDDQPNTSSTSWNNIPIFRLEGNLRIYINQDMLNTLNDFTWRNGSNNNGKTITNINDFKDVNYYYYYKNAKTFSNEIKDILGNIDLNPSKDGTGIYQNVKTESFNNKYSIITRDGDGVSLNDIKQSKSTSENKVNVSHTKYSYDDVGNKVFELSSNNDPELESSAFNRHRIDVIVSSIESTLTSAIASFNQFQSATYSYRMPTISENDWDKIANNVCTISFMQGLSIGNYKYYNNYAVVANTKNKEFVSKDAIYVQNVTNSLNSEYLTSTGNYHNPRCNEYSSTYYDKEKDDKYSSKIKDGTEIPVVGYRTIDYEIQSFSHNKEVSNYYLQPGTGAYECIVSLSKNYISYDDLMLLKTGKIDDIYYSLAISKAYVQTLAREKNAESKTFELYN